MEDVHTPPVSGERKTMEAVPMRRCFSTLPLMFYGSTAAGSDGSFMALARYSVPLQLPGRWRYSMIYRFKGGADRKFCLREIDLGLCRESLWHNHFWRRGWNARNLAVAPVFRAVAKVKQHMSAFTDIHIFAGKTKGWSDPQATGLFSISWPPARDNRQQAAGPMPSGVIFELTRQSTPLAFDGACTT